MDTTTNYGLKKPAYEDGADVAALNDNADEIDTELKKAEDHLADTANPHHTTAAQVGALPDSTTTLPSPASLTIQNGPGNTPATYDGSTAKTVQVPYFTVHSSAPSSTPGVGELWGVY